MRFSTLVVGDDIESLLDPFYCERVVDPYWVEADQVSYAMLFGDRGPAYTEDDLDQWAQSMGYEQARTLPDGRVELSTTYNRDARWDWYEVGGGWSQGLALKPGLGDDDLARCEGVAPEAASGRIGADAAPAGLVDWEASTGFAAAIIDGVWHDAEPRYSEFRSDDGSVDWEAAQKDAAEQRSAFEQMLREALAGLDPDVRVTVVDCHT